MRILLLILLSSSLSCNTDRGNKSISQIKPAPVKDSVVAIHMHLSAFGVESDYAPNIDADIDFKSSSSSCKKTYYNPAIPDSSYTLSKKELNYLTDILQDSSLDKLKTDYRKPASDQPTSTTTIITKTKTYTIKDYGLEGDKPLQELYRVVYKLGY